MSVLLEYWRSNALTVNLGDFITEFLVGAMGFEPVCYPCLDQSGREKFGGCLFGVGTILDTYWFERVKLRKVVCGSGFGGDRKFLGGAWKDNSVIQAVRGPLTKKYLELGDDVAVGDLALLMPVFLPIETEGESGIAYIPHFESRDDLPRSTLHGIQADRFVDICCIREDFVARIRDLVSSRFILTSSLHGAILAHAYQRPWALCVPEGARHNIPTKWLDWFAYLGMDLRFCTGYTDGYKWWHETGRHTSRAGTEQLLDAFGRSCQMAGPL